jgi:predicted ferric reductase
LDLHRYLGVLSLVTVAAHMATLVGDNWTHFAWRELFVPQASPWRTAAVTWGVIAFYLLVVIQVTSWFMKWLPRKLWHGVHLLSYVLFIMVTVHGFMAGSDTTNLVFFAIACGVCAILLFAFAARVLQGRARRTKRVASAPAVPNLRAVASSPSDTSERAAHLG